MFESHAFLLHLRNSPKYWDTLPTTLQIDYKPIPNDATKHFRMTTSGFGRNWTTPRVRLANPEIPMPGHHRGGFSRSRPNRDSRIPESRDSAKPGFPISRIPGIFPIPAKSGFKVPSSPISRNPGPIGIGKIPAIFPSDFPGQIGAGRGGIRG